MNFGFAITEEDEKDRAGKHEDNLLQNKDTLAFIRYIHYIRPGEQVCDYSWSWLASQLTRNVFPIM